MCPHIPVAIRVMKPSHIMQLLGPALCTFERGSGKANDLELCENKHGFDCLKESGECCSRQKILPFAFNSVLLNDERKRENEK